MTDWAIVMSRPDFTDAEKDARWKTYFDARGMKYDPLHRPKKGRKQ